MDELIARSFTPAGVTAPLPGDPPRASLFTWRRLSWVAPALLLAVGLLLLCAHLIQPPLHDRSRASAWWSSVAFYLRAFQFHLGCAMLACAIIALVRRRLGVATLSMVVGLASAAHEVRSHWPAIPLVQSPSSLRLLSVNQLRGNGDTSLLMALIDDEKPDLIAIQEYSELHDHQIADALASRYPHNLRLPFPVSNGLAVFSRKKITPDVMPSMDFAGNRMMSVWVDVAGERVRLFNIHPTSPGFPSRIAANRHQVSQLIARLRMFDGPTIVAGDFNFTPNSQQADALREAGFRPADDFGGQGIRWSWSPLRNGPPLVRIDHVFVSNHFTVSRNSIGPGVGSDHRPVLVDVALSTHARGEQASAMQR